MKKQKEEKERLKPSRKVDRVYVLSKDGKPLMPTIRFGKVRKMLKNGEAKIVDRDPFTIQLLRESTEYVQEISLGVDAGSKNIGLSATTEKKALFEGIVKLREDVVKNLSTKREARRARRNRKTRYRKPRFLNRKKSKKKGWLAPSIRQKIETHLTAVAKVHKFLPISKIIVETASFDIQKIKNPEISGKEYQQGDQLGFWNVREYVLFRDGHKCQCCFGDSKDDILNVHHIETRKVGGDAPNNLITLCETCHNKYHNGEIQLPARIKRGMSFKDAAFMGIMRWAFFGELKQKYENVHMTFGYITKNVRIKNKLPKDHYIDARCISGNPNAESSGIVHCFKKVRRHNRQIHEFKCRKGSTTRRNNQAPYLVKGFRLFDKVLYNSTECFVTGRRQTGGFALKDFNGKSISENKTFRKLKFLEPPTGFIYQQMAEI